MEKVLPEIVQEVPGPVTHDAEGNVVASDKTYKGIQYDALIAVLVKGMQEQNEKIINLQAQINAITAQGKPEAKAAVQTVILDNTIQQVVLNQNAPNPFSEKTIIAYQVPAKSKNAEIRFYDASGILIKTAQLVNKGKASLEVYGSGVASGVYTYVLYVDGKIMANRKMIRQ